MGLRSAETPVFAPVASIVPAVLASVTSTANAAPDRYGGTGYGGGARPPATADDTGSTNSACRPREPSAPARKRLARRQAFPLISSPYSRPLTAAIRRRQPRDITRMG